MKIEILLATMFFEREEPSFLDELNLQSDIIIGNQCDYDENKTFQHNGNTVTVLSRNARGVGKNRNTCLLYSNADIIMFADNDVRYYDGYAQKIEEYYARNPKADVVIFNFKVQRGEEPLHDINRKDKKAKLRDITKFGTWAITARRVGILKKRISFSLLFGGGAKHSMGEDSLFLIDCYNRGLNIYLSSITLGEVIHKESTWFNGITEKYLLDKGALFQASFPKTHKLMLFYHFLHHRKAYRKFNNGKNVIKLMYKGAKDFKNCKVL